MKGWEVRRLIKQVEKMPAPACGQKPEPHAAVPFAGFSFGERLTRNLALAGMLVLSVVAVRTASLPNGQTVLAAVQDMIDGQWGDHLGKIEFVSNFFPDTVAVFFEASTPGVLTAPCLGPVSHSWSKEEPDVAYQSKDGKVFAAASGQVMSIAHGPSEEVILRVRHEDGLETMYYNLQAIYVHEGDQVTESSCLGLLLPGKEAAIEVRRSGISIDPNALIRPRSEDPA